MKFDPENKKPGIYDESIHEYHRGRLKGVISKSYLVKHLDCPAAVLVPDEDSDDKLLGRAMHPYILPGQEECFHQEFALLPDFTCPDGQNPRGWHNTDKYKALKSSFIESCQANGVDIITQEQFDTIKAMKNGVFSNPNAAAFLSKGIPEMTLVWQDTDIVMPDGSCFEGTGLWCKSRPDWTVIESEDMFDLKKSRFIKRHAFQSEMVARGYHIQAAMAFEAMWRLLGKAFKSFTMIVVRDKPPFQCETYPLEQRWFTEGVKQFHRLLHIEAKCQEEKFWPNYELTLTEGQPINLRQAKAEELLVPGWMKSEESMPWEMM